MFDTILPDHSYISDSYYLGMVFEYAVVLTDNDSRSYTARPHSTQIYSKILFISLIDEINDCTYFRVNRLSCNKNIISNSSVNVKSSNLRSKLQVTCY